MPALWSGHLTLPSGRVIQDIFLSSPNTPFSLASNAPLRFLSLVEISRIPLYLAAGPSLDVSTTCLEIEDWFTTLLVNIEQYSGNEDRICWWNSMVAQSPIGILAQVITEGSQGDTPRITEILFYCDASGCQGASSFPTPPGSSPSISSGPNLLLKALPLSSDIISQPDGFESNIAGTIAPASLSGQTLLDQSATITPGEGEIESNKRKSVDKVFDQATEQRKKAKRKPAESLGLAISKHEGVLSLSHKRKASMDLRTVPTGPSSPLADVFRTRSPSFTSDTRPTSRKGTLDPQQKHSSLSRVTSISMETTIEEKNRDAISRLVMAGMRMHGLQQRKKSKRGKPADNEDVAAQAEQDAKDAASDEEYKLIYHQAFKGTVFAFRRTIATSSLSSNSEVLRDTVEKFLAIFCTDPTSTPATSDLQDSGTPLAGGSLTTPGKTDPFAVPLSSQPSPLKRFNTPQVRSVPKDTG